MGKKGRQRRERTRQVDNKSKRKSSLGVDLINQLPDDILFKILSVLTLKESVRTCIFSRKWEQLWRLKSGSNIVLRTYERMNDEEQNKFVAWVDRKLKSSMIQLVHNFVVHFCLPPRLSDALNSWFVFALENNVQRLDLNLMENDDSLCKFPDLRKCSPSPPVNIYLKEVRLSFLMVDEIAMFNYFLSKCPALEHLSLRNIGGLWCLNVAGEALKCLEVYKCLCLNLVISAPNLVLFCYDGNMNDVELRSVPRLSEFTINRAFYTDTFVVEILRGFGLANQLTTLKLEMSFTMVAEKISYPQTQTTFPVLKHLEIDVFTSKQHRLVWPILLIKAAPMLHTFKVKTRYWLKDNRVNSHWLSSKEVHNSKETPKRNWNGHKCLKVVEFYSFAGYKEQWELIRRIVRIAQLLESVVLDLNVSDGCFPIDSFIKDVKTTAERLLEPNIKLIIRITGAHK